MDAQKNKLSMTMEELEKKFKKLSLHVKEDQKKVKESWKKIHNATMGYTKQPAMEMPTPSKLPRNPTKQDIIREINNIIELCEDTQNLVNEKKKREAGVFGRLNKKREADVFGGPLETIIIGEAIGEAAGAASESDDLGSFDLGSLLDALLECFD